MEALDLLRRRRSVKVAQLGEPGPSEAEIRTICEVAMRVPDHGKLAPWKIILLRDAGQKKLGDLAADIFMAEHAGQATEKHRAFEAARFSRAPLCIAVLSCPRRGKIPVWEQELSAGAVCMNMLHAAHALGYAGQWLSEWPAFDARICAALGGNPKEGDNIAGFMYIGTASHAPDERVRPAFHDVVRDWG
jgi:nitroreductase